MKVCIFGAASDHIDKKFVKTAEKLGAHLVDNGFEIIFGAGGTGLMGAVARGAKANGGHIHGIVPAFFEAEGFDSPFFDLDEITLTEDIATRKRIMIEQSDAFIILPGGIGTLEEFFDVLSLKLFERHNKTVVVYNINDYYNGLDEFIKTAQNLGFINVDRNELYAIAKSDAEVIKLLQSNPRNPIFHRKKN